MMDDQTTASWGARVNIAWTQIAKDCPSWANPRQRDKWGKRGLVMWDHGDKEITWLSPTITLRLLNQLRTTDDWKEQGLIIGEPAVGFSLDDPGRKSYRTLVDEMSLSPQRLRVDLELLEGHEASLKKLSEEQEAERQRRISEAYRIILEYKGPREEKEQTATGNDE